MTPVGTPVLELRHVDIRYGRVTVVEDASFEVAKGEFVTLLGPSGSGKTSLLRAIAGFVVPSAGEVRLDGARMESVPPFERDVGMVFQNYALFPHMTVAKNLSFGPRMMHIPKAETETRVNDALAKVQLSEFAGRYPHELSGGQQQRVAIARALAMRPSLLLLDEPMSNLDARLRAQMRSQLIELLKGLGVTALAVTHNQEEALAMSDRIIVMAQGGIRQIGVPTEIYRRPVDAFVADFIGDANVIHARYTGSVGDLARFDADAGVRFYAVNPVVGGLDQCVLLVRPESIVLTRESDASAGDEHGNRVCGRLASRAYMGAFVEMRVATATQEFLVKGAANREIGDFQVGDRVVMHWDATAVAALPRR